MKNSLTFVLEFIENQTKEAIFLIREATRSMSSKIMPSIFLDKKQYLQSHKFNHKLSCHQPYEIQAIFQQRTF